MLKQNCLSVIRVSFLAFFLNLSAFALGPESQSPAPQVPQEPEPQADEPRTPPSQDPAQVLRPAETASSPSTGRRILENFWSDEKAFFTSPFRINRHNAKWWGLFGGGTAALIATDHRTSNALPNTARQISFSKNLSRLGAEYTTLSIAGGLYLYGRKTNNPRAREVGVLGVQALLDSGVLVQVLKLAAGRERPDLPGGNGRFLKGKDGFPSGHAIGMWSFASLISHEYETSKIVPLITYGLATAVSASRFSGRRHFPSDIVAGGAMGWFIGRYVWEQHQDPNIHKRYDRVPIVRFIPEINPLFQPGSSTYGLSLAWR